MPVTSTPPIVVTFRPSEDDYIALMDRYWKITPGRVWALRAVQALVIAVGAVAAYLTWKTHDPVFGIAVLVMLWELYT